MTEIPDATSGDYTRDVHTAILRAVRHQHDFGGWLAGVLASVSADPGSPFTLTAQRPGSWKADLVQQLVKGTVGYDDDYLTDFKEPLS